MDSSSTTHAWDRGESSRTKQHTISLMWRISLIKVSSIQSNSTIVHMWHTQVRYWGVLCCLFTHTGHSSNCSYGASLVTVDTVMCGFHFPAICIIRQPTRCIIRATVTKSTMPIIQVLLRHYCNVILVFNWHNVSISVNPDGKRTWIADLCSASWSDAAIFSLT